MLHYPGRVGVYPGLFIMRLREPLYCSVIAAQFLLQDAAHITRKPAAAIVGFYSRHIYRARQQHLSRYWFCNLHRLLCVQHIKHIGLICECNAIVDAAQVISTGIRRISIVAYLLELRQFPGIGLKAGIQPALQVNRLLLVVG